MKNKICVVTGANSGIGKETCLALASQGAEIVMVCRNSDKGKAAQAEIIQQSGNNAVSLFLADFALLADVRRVAAEIAEKYPAIDVLVNNAGAIFDARQLTSDGYEMTFAVNHLAPFLFTNLLMPNLKAAPSARIVNLASEAQRMGKFFWDDLHLANGYSSMKAYCQSKLANIVFTYELARRLEKTNITTNCMHPGVVRTNFGKELKGVTKIFFSLFSVFMRGPKKGAETAVWLASSDQVNAISGNYYSDKQTLNSIPTSYDTDVQKKLWKISEKMTELKS